MEEELGLLESEEELALLERYLESVTKTREGLSSVVMLDWPPQLRKY